MSLVIVDWDQSAVFRENRRSVLMAVRGGQSGDMLDMKRMAEALLSFLRICVDIGEITVPANVLKLLLHSRISDYSFGRIKVHSLTSNYARTKFPNAEYEVMITLTEACNGPTHVFLLYP